MKRDATGVVLAEQEKVPASICVYCYKQLGKRLTFQMIKKDGEIEQACCAHCGLLRFDDIREDVVQIICKDFLTDLTLSGKQAYYVIHADLHLNCCEPQLIPFSNRSNAERFEQGFGGEVLSLEEAIQAIKHEMSGPVCHDKGR